MYRLNFYPEFSARRRERRRHTLRFGVLAALVGVELALAGALVLSGLLLGDQARALRARVSRLTELAGGTSGAGEELEIVRELVARRQGRVDWAPKLAAVAASCDPALGLLEVKAEAGRSRRAARLEVSGSFRSAERDAGRVLEFVEDLSADPRISFDFPPARLESVDWSGAGRFRIVCERGGEQS